jgi:hypothetical protein
MAMAGPAAADAAAERADRALALFARACLDEGPGFAGSVAAFEAAGLARPDGTPFHRSADGVIEALAAPAGTLPGTPAGTCSVFAQGSGFAPAEDRVAALLADHLAAAPARHDAPDTTAGGIEPEESVVFTWAGDGVAAQVMLVRDADRALGLSLVMTPEAGE